MWTRGGRGACGRAVGVPGRQLDLGLNAASGSRLELDLGAEALGLAEIASGRW